MSKVQTEKKMKTMPSHKIHLPAAIYSLEGSGLEALLDAFFFEAAKPGTAPGDCSTAPLYLMPAKDAANNFYPILAIIQEPGTGGNYHAGCLRNFIPCDDKKVYREFIVRSFWSFKGN
jgi:hypothetical protein